MSSTNIACAQIDCVLGDPKTNLQKIISTIRSAAEREAKLVMFPECALTGYAYNSLAEAIPFAETIDGPSSQAVAEVCRDTGAYAVVGFIEAAEDKFYNAAMLVGPDGVVGGYRKVHLPFIGIDRFLTPGDRQFEVFDLPFGKIGMNICYDISFPEAARGRQTGVPGDRFSRWPYSRRAPTPRLLWGMRQSGLTPLLRRAR